MKTSSGQTFCGTSPQTSPAGAGETGDVLCARHPTAKYINTTAGRNGHVRVRSASVSSNPIVRPASGPRPLPFFPRGSKRSLTPLMSSAAMVSRNKRHDRSRRRAQKVRNADGGEPDSGTVRHFGLVGAGVGRAWRGRGAGVACDPWSVHQSPRPRAGGQLLGVRNQNQFNGGPGG
eukprot:gene13872-biopygen12592